MKTNILHKSDHYFVSLKNDEFLYNQRVAGKVVAKTLSMLESFISDGKDYSLLQMNDLADQFINDSGCISTFKNYKGFPGSICISVNDVAVHGIPNEYHPSEGDVISFDLGATYNGAVADSALTCIFGKPKDQKHIELIKATNDCLYAGINAIKVGNRLGCIGYAISQAAKKSGFSSITSYGGHSLCNIVNGKWDGAPHADPFVSNEGLPYEGIRIQSGLTIAIEPQLVLGKSNKTKVMKDGWSVQTENISCHQEHTVFIHENHVEIITDRNI